MNKVWINSSALLNIKQMVGKKKNHTPKPASATIYTLCEQHILYAIHVYIYCQHKFVVHNRYYHTRKKWFGVCYVATMKRSMFPCQTRKMLGYTNLNTTLEGLFYFILFEWYQ